MAGVAGRVSTLDTVFVLNISISPIFKQSSASLSEDQKKPTLTVHLGTNTSQAGTEDDVKYTIDYAKVCEEVRTVAEAEHDSPSDLISKIRAVCIEKFGPEELHVVLEFPSEPRVIYESNKSRDGTQTISVQIKELKLSAEIGVYPKERGQKQSIMIGFKLHLEPRQEKYFQNLNGLIQNISHNVERSNFLTVEALVANIAQHCLEFDPKTISNVTVRVEKTEALTFAFSGGVEITRDQVWLSQRKSSTLPVNGLVDGHSVFIAFGSNVGNCTEKIHRALSLISEKGIGRIVNSSFLYQTAPMYYADQPKFLNGVVKICTSLSPEKLLKALKEIEVSVGRESSFRNAPRTIDLDILFYDDLVLNTEELIVPHPRIAERAFVLTPLCDISKDLTHPVLKVSVSSLLYLLLSKDPAAETNILKVLPFNLPSGEQFWNFKNKTYIMAILNRTPDSFSCTGKHFELETCVEAAKKTIQDGADILDLGGMSTRPDADEDFPVEEEIRRVVPVIKKLREIGFEIPISVDTHRAPVAKAAVEAGANFINDVSGGSRDPAMLGVMAAAQVPVCLMHMRGNSKTMRSVQNTTYEAGDIIAGVNKELGVLVELALAAGVFRWNIVIDPGLGFAKNGPQNFEVLRNLNRFNGSGSPFFGYPSLLAPSNKSFIGGFLGIQDASKRSTGTAATVAASIAGGAGIVRVHDVRQMWEVARVCDTIWKP